jgi:hypothetical protein
LDDFSWGAHVALLGKERHGGAKAVERTDIDVGRSGFHSERRAALSQISVDERAEIFVGAPARDPQAPERREDVAWGLEGAPNPM